MGNRSIAAQKCIHVKHLGHVYSIAIPNYATTEQLTEIIKYRTNTRDSFKIVLKNTEGQTVAIHHEIKPTSYKMPYILEIYSSDVYGIDLDTEKISKNVTEDISKCFKELNHLKKMMLDISVRTTQNEIQKSMSIDNFSIYPMYLLSPETINHLKTPTFKIWNWEQHEMLSILEFMFEDLGLINEFKIERTTLKKWLMCIQSNYRNNPFHNFRHCFCVTQMMYGIIHLCELNKVMSRVELGILLVAAICHDLDHPGFDNTYQINACTELAIRYNDISPLENHHCAVTFQILRNPLCNIFANVSNETYKKIRAEIVNLILATDMARHREIIRTFKKNLENFDYENSDHMDSLKMILLKCCDISNEVRPFDVSEPWVDCLHEEYFLQSDREKKEGLPVAYFMDRDLVSKSSSQILFIKSILLPMFETILKLFPQIKEPIIQPLIDSYIRYEKMKSAEDKSDENADGHKDT